MTKAPPATLAERYQHGRRLRAKTPLAQHADLRASAALATNISKKRARAMAAATVEEYRTRIRGLAELSPLEVWHSRIELTREIKHIGDRALRRKLRAIVAQARSHVAEDDNFPHL